MAIPEHLEKLRQGVTLWNKWRADNHDIKPDLSGLNFTDELFCIPEDKNGVSWVMPINFSEVDFTKTTFTNCNLEGSDFHESLLHQTQFTNSDLCSGNFIRADLVDAEFDSCQMQSALFVDVSGIASGFFECDLRLAKIKDSRFGGARFLECNLSDSICTNTLFIDANFTKTNLDVADFTASDLRNVVGLELDNSTIKDTRLSRDGDTWTLLKYAYTGSTFFFHLIFLSGFFIPFVIQAFVWRTFNRAQTMYEAILTTNGTQASSTVALSPCFAEECERWNILSLLLGLHRGWFWAALAILILTYNAIRLFLTRRVGILRDQEELGGMLTPGKGESLSRYLVLLIRNLRPFSKLGLQALSEQFQGSYLWLMPLHRFLKVIFWISVASSLLNVTRWLLFDYVFLPK